MRKKQSVTLYNILFPIWMLVWIPSPLWLLLIPLNFIIDYLVLYKSLPADVQRSKTSALWLAVVTAPYLFLLPSEILYRV